MTNSQPHLRNPTPRQIDYLKDLALSTGQSFTYPQSFDEADAWMTETILHTRARLNLKTSPAVRRP